MVRIQHPSGSFIHSLHIPSKSVTKCPEMFWERSKSFETTAEAQKFLSRNLKKFKDLKGCKVVIVGLAG